MKTKIARTISIPSEIDQQLRMIKEKDGIPVSSQIVVALRGRWSKQGGDDAE